MKKMNLFTTIAFAAALTSCCGLFAACGDEDAHTHTFSTDWSKDASGHWHVATCDDLKEGDEGYKKDFAAHVWGDDDECDVCKYVKQAATEITLNKTALALSIANTEDTLTATLNGTGTVAWTSSDETVVQVGAETGAVEALKPGAATITATVTGTEVTATCQVTVADAYYIIGGMDSDWNKAGAFGGNFAYFMPTETEGIYKTNSFELRKFGNFQVAPVGDTTKDWYKKAFNGDYIKADDTVLIKNSGGNIAVEKHGMYTITLDLRGEKAVISGVCDREIEDPETETIYYLFGSMSSWAVADTVDAAGEYAFTNNSDGTITLTVELARDTEFKVLAVGMKYDIEFAGSAVPLNLIGDKGSATVDTEYKLTWTNSANIGVGLSGEYTFTLNPDGGAHNILSYTFQKTDDTETAPAILHYYIKGDALTVENGWNVGAKEAYELKETAEASGEYTITIELKNTGAFMFWASAEDKNGNVTGQQADYFNDETIKKLNAANDCVIVSGTNYAPAAAGWYTITLNPTTKTLTVSYSATNPDSGASTPDPEPAA
ncbi:MAG: Ig-like domain-containing protein [Clostridia bacterium]|nr:Ig-like domain-containing protein [Clostridia bacterium]